MKNAVATLATALTIGCNAGLAQSAPNPVRDIIDNCSHQTGNRTEVVDQFAELGWLALEEGQQSWFHEFLADGSLLVHWTLADVLPDAALQTGTDLTSGVIPVADQSFYHSMSRAIADGRINWLWTDTPYRSMIMLFDQDNPVNGQSELHCRLYANELEAIELVQEAFVAVSPMWDRQYGPVHFLKDQFYGGAPHQPETGILLLAVHLGILEARPVFDAQIGAGKSEIALFILDKDDFQSRYNRMPNASFGIEIRRIESN